MLTIVVVEDNDILRSIYVDHLRRLGYRVHSGADAESITNELAGVEPDIYLLDLNLPGEDGLSLARRLRGVDPKVGIVMVTGRDTLEDRLAGYDAGADAYIGKPFTIDELQAVISAVARRVQPSDHPPYVLDVRTHTLTGPSGSVVLSEAQAALLERLARAPDHELETWQVVVSLGQSIDTYQKAALEVQVTRIRDRLERVGADRAALTAVRRYGYRLTIPLSVRRGEE